MRLRLVLVVVLTSIGLQASPGTAAGFVTQVQSVTKASSSDSSAVRSASATCPSGTRVVGAGAAVMRGGSPGAQNVFVDAIRPDPTLTWVTARARERGDGTMDDWSLVASAVCAAPPAGLQRVAAHSTPGSANASVVAACPSGKRLLGTGGETAGAAGQVHLDDLHPDAALTRTTVRAVEDSAGTDESWTVSAYAICANPLAGLQRVAANSALDSTSPKSPRADCPAGKAALGSGVSIDSPGGQVVLDAARAVGTPPSAVQAEAWEHGAGTEADWSVSAYAICAATARRVSSAHGVEGNDVGLWQTPCPGGTDAVSAGAQIIHGRGAAWIRWLRVPTLDFAEVLTDAYSADAQWSVTVHAICVTKQPGTTVVSEAGTNDGAIDDERGTATVTCPAGTRVLSAGGQAHDGAPGAAGQHQINLVEIRPSATLTSVTVTAINDDSWETGPWRPRAWAVCAPPPAGLQRVAASSETDRDDFAATTAHCPPGKHLVGTGGAVNDGDVVVGLDDIVPNAALTSTTVAGTHTWGVEPRSWSATAYAICINR